MAQLTLFGRVRHALSAMATGWSWRGGIGGGGSASVFSGQKHSGAKTYPSGFMLDHQTLRNMARAAKWDSVETHSIIGRLTDNAVNTGLSLEAAPIWDLVAKDWTEEKRQAWREDVEARFGLWMNSTEPDASGRRTGYQLQDFVLQNAFFEGEVFGVHRYSSDTSRMSPLNTQFISPDQFDSPKQVEFLAAIKARGNYLIDGIEIDNAGLEIAYYALDPYLTARNTVYTSWIVPPLVETRIPKYGGKSNRLFVSHVAITDAVGQVRGIPIIANMIHELSKLTDYESSELEAAVINALIAAWVEPGPMAPSSRPLSGVRKAGESDESGGSDPKKPPRGIVKVPGLFIQNLEAGEKIQSFNTVRPNVNFEIFTKAVMAKLSASLGIPLEVLLMSFNANYSASRACLLLFWNVIEKWREFLNAGWNNPIYKEWMRCEVAAKRIEAAGIFGDSPVITAAWLNCTWNGINKPSIDPQAEAKAANLRLEAGMSTREKEAQAYNGSSFAENAERLKTENAALAEANAPLAPPAPIKQPGASSDMPAGTSPTEQAAAMAHAEHEVLLAREQARDARQSKDIQQLLFSFERARAETRAVREIVEEIATRPPVAIRKTVSRDKENNITEIIEEPVGALNGK